MNYPVEARLRPPFELLSAGYFGVIAIGAFLIKPIPLLLPIELTIGVGCGCTVAAIVRARKGWKVIRYQRNLRKLPEYVINPGELPTSAKHLFLGMGFQWDQRHTQRLLDSRQPKYARYVNPNRLYKIARSFEFTHEHTLWAQPLLRAIKATHWFGMKNPLAPLPPVGGETAIHGVELEEKEINLPLSETPGHTLVLGTTRVGKTRLAEVLITQDIRRGDVVLVFDPKGDVDLLVRMYIEAMRCGRADDFVFFHLGYPEMSARHNPNDSFARITEIATRIAGQLPGEGQSAAFKDFVWRFVNVLNRTMVALGIKPSYENVYHHAVHIDVLAKQYITEWLDRQYPGWPEQLDLIAESGAKALEKQSQKTGRDIESLQLLQLISENKWHDPIVDGLASILVNDRSYFEKLVSSLYPLLEKLTTGRVAKLLSPDYGDLADERPVFDWLTAINRNQIVYVGLDSLSDTEVAHAVGNAMFADLTSVAGRLYKFGQGFGQNGGGQRKRIRIHGDEFNELSGDESIPLANKCGGAGMELTLYTQTSSDVLSTFGNVHKAGQLFGNMNNLIMLRVKDTATAEILTEQLPECEYLTLTDMSSSSDTNDPREFAEFGSQSRDQITRTKVPLLAPADVMRLPKGQAFSLTEGGKLHKLRLPLFDPSADSGFPKTLAQVSAKMKANRSIRAANVTGTLVVSGEQYGNK